MDIIGIDLGTTNSVVAFVDDAGLAHAIAARDGERVIPSVVWFPPDDPSRVEVGDLARKQAVIDSAHVAQLFKRGMGNATFLEDGSPFRARDKEWRPEELSSLVLKKMVSIASDHFGREIKDVMITVPAYFGEAERAATKQAGEMLGLTVHGLPAEPMAAAVAHGLDGSTDARRFLVFDLGGGTFDVTILERKDDGQLVAKSHHGSRRLGGADFDRLIVGRMSEVALRDHKVALDADPEDLASAYAAAEEIKKELSSRDKSQALLIAGGKRVTFTLTRVELEALLAKYLEDVEDTVQTAMDQVDLEPGDMDAVLMVGGSSRIPMFQELITRMFGKQPQFSKNLDEDVARGAAMMGVLKAGTASPTSALAGLPAPIDSSAHAIGVVALNAAGVEENTVVLPANAAIPTDPPAERTFGVARDGQDRIELIVNEGDETDLRYVARLGSATGDLRGPKAQGYPILVRMRLDADGILHATAHDGQTQALLTEVVVTREGSMSKAQRIAAEQALDDVVVI